jgi:hypothetical protein
MLIFRRTILGRSHSTDAHIRFIMQYSRPSNHRLKAFKASHSTDTCTHFMRHYKRLYLSINRPGSITLHRYSYPLHRAILKNLQSSSKKPYRYHTPPTLIPVLCDTINGFIFRLTVQGVSHSAGTCIRFNMQHHRLFHLSNKQSR